jgi:orotate phosphoribosyltransferase-like protein
MILHHAIKETILYPTGRHIQNNIAKIEYMAYVLATLIQKEYTNPDKERILLFCRGSSGSIISAITSKILIQVTKKYVEIHYITKDEESSHNEINSEYFSSNYVEENIISVIVDDFICTGATIHAIMQKIDKYKINILCISGPIGDSNIEDFNDYFEHCICGY